MNAKMHECYFIKDFTQLMHHAAWSLFQYPHLMNFSHHSTVQMDFFGLNASNYSKAHRSPNLLGQLAYRLVAGTYKGQKLYDAMVQHVHNLSSME